MRKRFFTAVLLIACLLSVNILSVSASNISDVSGYGEGTAEEAAGRITDKSGKSDADPVETAETDETAKTAGTAKTYTAGAAGTSDEDAVETAGALEAEEAETAEAETDGTAEAGTDETADAEADLRQFFSGAEVSGADLLPGALEAKEDDRDSGPGEVLSKGASACAYGFAYKNSIYVFNTSSENSVYAAVVSSDTVFSSGDARESGALRVEGVEILPDDVELITQESLPDGTRRDLEYATPYYVLAGFDSLISLEKGNIVENSDSGEELFRTEELKKTSVAQPGDVSSLLDGSAVQFRASVQKNNCVSLKWNPSSAGKSYSEYALYRLKTDGSWAMIMDRSKKKAFRENTRHFQDVDNGYTEIYKLECYPGAAGGKDSYVTVPSPWMYYVESGDTENTMEFCFTELTDCDYISYDLEVLKSKKETPSSEAVLNKPSIELDEIEYSINRKLKAKAVRPTYYTDSVSMVEGTPYYCRVRSVLNLGSLTVRSEPSNTLVNKQGPPKCELYFMSGLRPDGSTVLDSGWIPSPAESYAVFTGPDRVKSYELLQLDKPYGRYRVIKRYASSAVQKYNTGELQEVFGDTQLYCLKYDNLPMEKKYYALRAVSMTGNARGGFMDGVPAMAGYGRVKNPAVGGETASSLQISWTSDTGVNEYWIYRDTVSANLSGELLSSQMVGKVRNRYKKNSTGSTLVYTDKKGLKDGTVYYYRIRPVFSRKLADKQKYGDTTEMYGYADTLSDVVRGMPTMANEKIGSVGVSVKNIEHITVKWSGLKAAKSYGIQLWETDSSGNAATLVLTREFAKGSPEFSSRRCDIKVPKIGQRYKAAVFARGEKTQSKSTYSASTYTYPENPSDLSASYYRYDKGGKLKWTNSSADRNYRGNIFYVIEYRDGDGSWKGLDTVNSYDSSYSDGVYLRRGVVRKYRMYAWYSSGSISVTNPKYTSSVSFCTPYRISVNSSAGTTSLTMDAGSTYTFKIYFYDVNGNTNTVTDRYLESVYSTNTKVFTVEGRGGGDGTGAAWVKVKGVAHGNASLMIRARDYDDDIYRLQKRVNISVR